MKTSTFLTLLVLLISFGFFVANVHAQQEGATYTIEYSDNDLIERGPYNNDTGNFSRTLLALGIVPCGFGVECQFCHLLVLAGNLLNFMVIMTSIVAALIFVNAGVLYITAGANPGNVSKAHKLFTSALIGLVIVLAAFLIINLVMFAFYEGGAVENQFGAWDTMLECDFPVDYT